MSRRTVLAGTATVSIAAVAGCTSVANWIAGQIVSDVNVFNETAESVDGEIELVGPGGDVVLAERFELDPQTDDDEDDDANTGDVYDDVWDDAGEYEVTVELDDGLEIQGQSQAEETVTIDDPDEQMLAVVFDTDELPDGISFAVGEEWSDFAENVGVTEEA